MIEITNPSQLKQHHAYFLDDGFNQIYEVHFLEVEPAKAKPGNWTMNECSSAQFIGWDIDPISASNRDDLLKLCKYLGIKVLKVKHEKAK